MEIETSRKHKREFSERKLFLSTNTFTPYTNKRLEKKVDHFGLTLSEAPQEKPVINEKKEVPQNNVKIAINNADDLIFGLQ